MKKILAVLPLIAVLGLAGCEDKKGEENEGGGGDHLELTEEQARAKVKELGESQGYEISFEVKATDSETSHLTLGVKEHFYWAYNDEDKTLYHIENNIYQGYSFDDETSEFKKAGEAIDLSLMPGEYKQMIEAATEGFAVYLYYANTYAQDEGLTKKGTVNFIGRSATKYEYKWVTPEASASYELIVDNATGITLKWAVAGQAYTGEKGAASMEATSFKTGSDVVIPVHEA